jgi:hypothetical protein
MSPWDRPCRSIGAVLWAEDMSASIHQFRFFQFPQFSCIMSRLQESWQGRFGGEQAWRGRIEPSRRQPNLRGGDPIRGKSFEMAVAPS